MSMEERISKIEAVQNEHQTDLATIEVKLENITEKIDDIKSILNMDNKERLNLLQKGAIAAILVQSLVHGITTPTIATEALKHLLGGLQ